MSVPSRVPLPPARLVPPNTTAAITVNSNPVAAWGAAAYSRAVRITPASAALKPERV